MISAFSSGVRRWRALERLSSITTLYVRPALSSVASMVGRLSLLTDGSKSMIEVRFEERPIGTKRLGVSHISCTVPCRPNARMISCGHSLHAFFSKSRGLSTHRSFSIELHLILIAKDDTSTGPSGTATREYFSRIRCTLASGECMKARAFWPELRPATKVGSTPQVT